MTVLIKDQGFGEGDRFADNGGIGIARQIIFGDRADNGKGGAFGRTIAVQNRDIGAGGDKGSDMLFADGIPADHQDIKSGKGAGIMIDLTVEQADTHEHFRDTKLRQSIAEFGRIKQVIPVNYGDFRPTQQGRPDFKGRGIKCQRPRLCHHITSDDFGVIRPKCQPMHGPLFDQNPLGRSGRARGIHDIGRQTVRVGQFGQGEVRRCRGNARDIYPLRGWTAGFGQCIKRVISDVIDQNQFGAAV